MGKRILSIIIPHYNRWDKLTRALDSIPRSDSIQIIVVDDKSDDYKIRFNDFKSKYDFVEFYENDTCEKNAGAARNVGLKKAKGEWLTFLDSDDFYLDTFLEAFKIIQKEIDADIIYFPPTSIVENTTQMSQRHIGYVKLVDSFLKDPSEKNELRLRFIWNSPCSKFIRNRLVIDEKIEFSSVSYGNDVMFSTKTAYAAKNIKVVSIPFYCITKSNASLTEDNKYFKVRYMRASIVVQKNLFLQKNLNRKQLKLLGRGLSSWIDVILILFGINTNDFKRLWNKEKLR